MNQSQKKFFKDKLTAANGKHRAVIQKTKERPPAAVVKARQLVLEYAMAQRERDQSRLERLSSAFDKVQETILFGSIEDARKALTNFDGQKF